MTTETLEFARTMLAVARATVTSLLLDYEPEHQRVKDARESVRGWTAEVERLREALDTLYHYTSDLANPPEETTP